MIGFSFITFLLTVSVVDLLVAMQRYKITNQTTKERHLLMSIFIIFTVTYATRIGWAVYLYRNPGVSSVDYFYHIQCLDFGLILLWDVVPIGMLLYHHYKNFKVREEVVSNSPVSSL